MNKPHYKFSLSIDLGAKNTGIFMVSHPVGELPTSKNCKAVTLITTPVKDGGLQYSTKIRTAVRHRLRGKKRFNLARRLLLLITSEMLKTKEIVLSAVEWKKMNESLSGLLKRRGYSHIDSETDLTVLEPLDAAVFANNEILGKLFQRRHFIGRSMGRPITESVCHQRLRNKRAI